MDAGRALRAARERAGLTQQELGRLAGTSQAAVSEIERGVVQPTIDRLSRLLWHTGQDLRVVADESPPARLDPQDLALIRRNLGLTPAERLVQLANRMRLRGLARR